jgi:hypothetical protein
MLQLQNVEQPQCYLCIVGYLDALLLKKEALLGQFSQDKEEDRPQLISSLLMGHSIQFKQANESVEQC